MPSAVYFHLSDSSFDKEIAEYIATVIDPDIKSRGGPWKWEEGRKYQLDSGDNWFYNISAKHKDTREIVHRYNNIKTASALRTLVIWRFFLLGNEDDGSSNRRR